MNGLGFRDWPDREVLKPQVFRVLWIEFKRPGEELTTSQEVMQEELMAMGQHVVTCFNDKEARAAYEAHRD